MPASKNKTSGAPNFAGNNVLPKVKLPSATASAKAVSSKTNRGASPQKKSKKEQNGSTSADNIKDNFPETHAEHHRQHHEHHSIHDPSLLVPTQNSITKQREAGKQEVMKWKHPEKFGDPKFAQKEHRPDENKFYFPRYYQYGVEHKMATHETASHWLTTSPYYKSKFLTGQRISKRQVDRGNLQSRWRRRRVEDEENRFGVSKHGVPVKLGEKGVNAEDKYGRLDAWREEESKRSSSSSSKHSDEDPYYYGDMYDEDPEIYFREKKKKLFSKKHLDPNSEKSSKTQKVLMPRPVTKRKPPPPKPEICQQPPEVDYIYENAKRVCTIPARRTTPIYVDDRNGTRKKYCKSGLAPLYVHKLDYGRIPEYLQERNEKLGRPREPDFKRFYRRHLCKYFNNNTHCCVCMKGLPTKCLEGFDNAFWPEEPTDPFSRRMDQRCEGDGQFEMDPDDVHEILRAGEKKSAYSMSSVGSCDCCHCCSNGTIPPPPPEFCDPDPTHERRRAPHRAQKRVPKRKNKQDRPSTYNVFKVKNEKIQTKPPTRGVKSKNTGKIKRGQPTVQETVSTNSLGFSTFSSISGGKVTDAGVGAGEVKDDEKPPTPHTPKGKFHFGSQRNVNSEEPKAGAEPSRKSRKSKKIKFQEVTRKSVFSVPASDVDRGGGEKAKESKKALRRGTPHARSGKFLFHGIKAKADPTVENLHPPNNHMGDEESDFDEDFEGKLPVDTKALGFL